MYTCKQCGRENEDHFKFCLGCGANLEEQRAEESGAEAADSIECPACGSEVLAGQRFCGHCGHNLDGPAPASAEAPAEKPAEKPAKKAAKKSASKPAAGGKQVGSLVKVNPDGSPGPAVPLFAGENVIGRDSEHEVLSSDRFLDGSHACFVVDGDTITVRDLDSLNGVYERITEITELSHGDMVRVGQEVLRFQLLDQSEPAVEASADGTTIAGSSPAGAWGTLERLSSPDVASFTFMLRGAEQVLGRERGDILFRDDGYVSGRHARLFADSGRYFIEDLKSSNGSFVRIRGERNIQSGTLLLLGEQPFRLHMG